MLPGLLRNWKNRWGRGGRVVLSAIRRLRQGHREARPGQRIGEHIYSFCCRGLPVRFQRGLTS